MPVCGIFVPVVQAHVMSMLDGLLHYSAHPDVSPPPPLDERSKYPRTKTPFFQPLRHGCGRALTI